MSFIEPICNRHELFVPSVIASFVSSDQENYGSTRVKGVKDPVWPPGVLNTQLLHVWKAGRTHGVRVRTGERWAAELQESYLLIDVVLLRLGQIVPPGFELVRVFDFPFH